MSVEIPKVSAKRQKDVFEATNAVISAALRGTHEDMKKASEGWEKVLSEGIFSPDERGEQ